MKKVVFLVVVVMFLGMERVWAFSCLDYFVDSYDLSLKSVNGIIKYQDESKEVVTNFYLELDLYSGKVGESIKEIEGMGVELVEVEVSPTEGVFETPYPKGIDYEDMGLSIDTVWKGSIGVDLWKKIFDKYRLRISEDNGKKSWKKFFSFRQKVFILIKDNDLGWGKIIEGIEREGFNVLNIKMKESEDKSGTEVVGVWLEKMDTASNIEDVVKKVGKDSGIENIEDIVKVFSNKKKAREEYNKFFEKGIFILGEKIVGFFRYFLVGE